MTQVQTPPTQDKDVNWYQGCKGDILGDTEAAKKAVLKQMEGTGKYVAQLKCDGEFGVVHGGKELHVVGRRDVTKPIKNHGLPAFPAGTLIVGELGRGSQTARKKKEELGHAFMDVHDILFFNHEWFGDLPDVERHKRLVQWHRKLWPDAQKFYQVLPLWTDRFVERYEDAAEGLILKAADHVGYTPGIKIPEWIKAKKEITDDFVIMGWTQSTAATKQSVPMVEKLICGLYIDGVLTEICRPGAMTNERSVDIAANFESKYKGTVVTLHGWAPRFESGSLRHPSVYNDTFRNDKDPKDCTWEVPAK